MEEPDDGRNRPVYRAEDWPHGLRCMVCDQVFTEGQPINEDLTRFVNGVPVVEVTCMGCAGKNGG